LAKIVLELIDQSFEATLKKDFFGFGVATNIDHPSQKYKLSYISLTI